jgi:3-deoxy-D-manno-octulosonate 8-phosphate phosphatase (KDO 8-P phosphatase)
MDLAGVFPEQTAFVGDDLRDADVMNHVGLGVAVADAVREVQAAAHRVTAASGGNGAIREIIDFLLGAKDG